MKPAKNIVPFVRRDPTERRREFELAFLPAALEIVETPPSPAGLTIGITIVALFCIALLWACLGKVDIVAVATGKVVPSGGTKLIQPLEIGIIRALRVEDGQRVKAGDVLIELDPTTNEAESDRAKRDLISTRLEIARINALLANPNDPAAGFRPPQDAPALQVEIQRHYLASQSAAQAAKLAEIDRQLAQKTAERQTIGEMIGKIEAVIPVLEERVNLRGDLFRKELGSKITYLTELQDLVGQKHDALVQKSRYQEAEATIASLRETRLKAEAEFRRSLYDDLTKAELKLSTVVQDVAKADQRARTQLLTAPVAGTVQQLSVHTVGGVVTPAQVLGIIVPATSQLEVEATIVNRDIGFVEVGQDVKIKVDTFNFTKYGFIHGKVTSISRDAVPRDNAANRTAEQSNVPSNSEPRGQELVYPARIELDQYDVELGDKTARVSPGMAVTAEIKTGSQRIIQYLLSPFERYRQESFQER